MHEIPIFLSIVIPTYNEERRLLPTLAAAKEYLKSSGIEGEIIISDDCSKDNTIEMASRFLDGINFKILPNHAHHGKGWVVRQGVLASQGNVVLFTDADLSTPFFVLDSMLPWVKKGHQCVIGTRNHPGAVLTVAQPFIRVLLGQIYLFLAKLILGICYTDINCGFKLFEGDVARQLFKLQQQWDWSFDTEILFLVNKMGYSIKEVPVTWSHKEGSKTRLLLDVPNSLRSLVQIRWRLGNRQY